MSCWVVAFIVDIFIMNGMEKKNRHFIDVQSIKMRRKRSLKRFRGCQKVNICLERFTQQEQKCTMLWNIERIIVLI